MLNIKVITPPVILPVSVDEMKEHLRIDHDLDDDDIERKIKAVVAQLDPPYGWLGRAMIAQTIQWSLSFFPGSLIALPYPPAQAFLSVKYLNSEDAETEFNKDNYIFNNNNEPAFICLKNNQSWPQDISYNDPFPIRLNFIAGYGESESEPDAQSVPEDIRSWIMMAVGDLYLAREHFLVGQSFGHNEFSRRIIDNHIYRHY